MFRQFLVLILVLHPGAFPAQAEPLLPIQLSQASAAQPKYQTYTNIRYLFRVDYPPQLLRPQGEAPNGDGQIFLSQDGLSELRVYGSYNSLGESLKDRYSQILATPGLKITSQEIQRYHYLIQGKLKQGKIIFCEKTYYQEGVFKTLQMVYPSAQSKRYAPILKKALASFEHAHPR